MYQINDIEMIREHRRALIAEAENLRLARQLKEARSNGATSSGSMLLKASLLLSTIGMAILLAASAAYALDEQCLPSVGGASCVGTEGLDLIVGPGDDDVIHDLGSPDRLIGDGSA